MFKERINKLREKLIEQKIDGLLVTNFFNIFYLTGFKGLSESEREAYVVVTKGKIYLITDQRYLAISNCNLPGGQLASNFEIKLITQEKKLIQHLKEIVIDEKIKILGFEGEDLKYFEYQGLVNNFPDIQLVATMQLINRLREIKEIKEIERLKKAAEIGDKCLTEIIKTIKSGQTEKEIAWKIEKWLKEKDYDYSFYPIVAIDESSAIPHYDTRSGACRHVRRGSVILIDFGVKYQNYCSDITRMFFFGKPKKEVINIYNKLQVTQQLTLRHCSRKTIKQLKEVDDYCRLQITNYGLQIYPHSTGHGVGLEVHEYPKLSMTSQDILQPNQIFTVEPGVYFEGKWGMRIEDTVMIKNKGEVEILTKFNKNFIILK